MTLWMLLLIIFIICQRIIELIIAKRNEKWMKDRGGIEQGKEHYKYFIFVHTLFFLAIIAELLHFGISNLTMNYPLLFLFIVTQIGRIWCILTLGKFWNTKIIVLPGVSLIKKGPYKYIKHPNYMIVGIELFIIPLLFGAYLTAIVFPILHIILLKTRISAEDKALARGVTPN